MNSGWVSQEKFQAIKEIQSLNIYGVAALSVTPNVNLPAKSEIFFFCLLIFIYFFNFILFLNFTKLY